MLTWQHEKTVIGASCIVVHRGSVSTARYEEKEAKGSKREGRKVNEESISIKESKTNGSDEDEYEDAKEQRGRA